MKYQKLPLFVTIWFSIFGIASAVLGQAADSCYQAFKEGDGLWRIVENKTVNIYVVEGEDSALVIDTGYGTGDLKTFIGTLTDLPLIVVNTHGHGDHVRGDYQFPRIYVHPNDFVLLKSSFGSGEGEKMICPPLIPIREDHRFDLGGRNLEVMEVPGHTSGSICLFDKKNKVIFAGDHINAVVWLFLDVCLPLETYQKSLKKVEARLSDFDVIMPGHNEPLEAAYLNELITGVGSILDGACSSVPYDYAPITKGSLMCTYKRANIAYDPKKLFEKK